MLNTIKDENCALLTDPGKVKTRWTEYFQTLLNEENDRNPTEELEPFMEVSREEVKNVLKSQKNGKQMDLMSCQ